MCHSLSIDTLIDKEAIFCLSVLAIKIDHDKLIDSIQVSRGIHAYVEIQVCSFPYNNC